MDSKEFVSTLAPTTPTQITRPTYASTPVPSDTTHKTCPASPTVQTAASLITSLNNVQQSAVPITTHTLLQTTVYKIVNPNSSIFPIKHA